MASFDNDFLSGFTANSGEAHFTESGLDGLFTRMNFDAFSDDLGSSGSPLSQVALETLSSSPATPLLNSWNYLDTIKEESHIELKRSMHRRVASHGDAKPSDFNAHVILGDGLEYEIIDSGMPSVPRRPRHSLPAIFAHDTDAKRFSYPNKGVDFVPIDFASDHHVPYRSSTEPPIPATIPLTFIMENPVAEYLPMMPSPKRRHSVSATVPLVIFKCTIDNCDKTFARQYNLNSHIKSHAMDRPYVCEKCTIGFARCHDLKRHEKIHSGDKPFQCQQCNKTFTRNDALTRHIRLGSCPLGSPSSMSSVMDSPLFG